MFLAGISTLFVLLLHSLLLCCSCLYRDDVTKRHSNEKGILDS